MSSINDIKEIMEKSNSNKIVILTDHYKISGKVHECIECNKEFYINLTDAYMCLLNDIYDENCEKYSNSNYKWLHVNLNRIVAFTFIKE